MEVENTKEISTKLIINIQLKHIDKKK